MAGVRYIVPKILGGPGNRVTLCFFEAMRGQARRLTQCEARRANAMRGQARRLTQCEAMRWWGVACRAMRCELARIDAMAGWCVVVSCCCVV